MVAILTQSHKALSSSHLKKPNFKSNSEIQLAIVPFKRSSKDIGKHTPAFHLTGIKFKMNRSSLKTFINFYLIALIVSEK